MNLTPIVSGINAYHYTAWASDSSGTGFTTTFNASLAYIAFKTVYNNPIASPQASDFTGLWVKYKGTDGANGTDGAIPAGHLSMTAAGMYPSTTNGCGAAEQIESTTNDVNYFIMPFDAAVAEYACGEATFPSDWDGGTLTAKIHWCANDTTTNSVVWKIQGLSLGDGDAIDTAWGTAISVTDANASTAYQQRTTALTSAITLGGTPAAGERVVIRISRDATNGSDTLASDAFLIGVTLNFTRA